MLVIAHRGASAAAEENTVRAFELAVAMGADGIELDVRRAADGRLWVKHDPLPEDGNLPSHIVNLDTALAACGDVLVNVEIKNSPGEYGYDAALAVVEPTIEVMRRHGRTDRWIFSSFDWETIQRCRELAPDIASAYLVEGLDAADIERTAAAGHRAIHPHASVLNEGSVQRCRDAGLAVNTWTSNDPGRLRELAELGIDGVCTDVPDVALIALGRRLGPVNPTWRDLAAETPA